MEYGKLARSYFFFLLCSGTEKQAFQPWVLVTFLKLAKVVTPCFKRAHVATSTCWVQQKFWECFDQIQSPSASSRHLWCTKLCHFTDQQLRRPRTTGCPRSRLLHELIPPGTPGNLRGNSTSGCQGSPRGVKVPQESLPGWEGQVDRQTEHF